MSAFSKTGEGQDAGLSDGDIERLRGIRVKSVFYCKKGHGGVGQLGSKVCPKCHIDMDAIGASQLFDVD